MSERALREHWIRGGLREWLSEYLRTESAQKLTAIQRMRLRMWGYLWPEHLHAFRCLIKDPTGRADEIQWWRAGVTERVKFRACLNNPVPLTWEEGHAPAFYENRTER